MVINADELDLSGVLYAIAGVSVGVLISALLIGLAAGRVSGRRFGWSSFALGLIIAIALVVDVVVLSRTWSGAVTAWDFVWAAGLTAAGYWAYRRLTTRSGAHPGHTQ